MAAANESQGLKIAVAVFVTLTVILAVSTYFAYTSYAERDAKLVAAEQKLQTANKAASDALAQAEEARKNMGVKAEDPEAIKAEIKKEYAKIDDALKSMTESVNTAVTKAQASGAQGAELEDAKGKVQQIAAAYRSEPNKTYISALARMSDLMQNLAMLTTEVSLNYVDVKRNLEATNGVNAQKLKVAEDALAAKSSELEKEIKRHDAERQTILAKIDQFQSENAKQATEIQNLTTKMRKMEDDYTKNLALSQQTIREQRAQMELKENVLDRPDGHVTYVDYGRNEVQVDVNRSMGVRPQMKFTIFDAASPGIPTDKPKGTIELTTVGDRYSVGRIVKTVSAIDPVRTGDIVYSVAFDRNEPMRFALIGKIDINRDGHDDREDLKRMIQAAGGIVDYDLPPPEVGRESGKLTGSDAWYVIDNRPPLVQEFSTRVHNVTSSENTEFIKKQTEATREARLNGVRPMPIGRLLPFLGYDYASPVRGRAEAVDKKAMKRVLSPVTNAPKPAADAAPKEGDEAKEEMK